MAIVERDSDQLEQPESRKSNLEIKEMESRYLFHLSFYLAEKSSF